MLREKFVQTISASATKESVENCQISKLPDSEKLAGQDTAFQNVRPTLWNTKPSSDRKTFWRDSASTAKVVSNDIRVFCRFLFQFCLFCFLKMLASINLRKKKSFEKVTSNNYLKTVKKFFVWDTFLRITVFSFGRLNFPSLFSPSFPFSSKENSVVTVF